MPRLIWVFAGHTCHFIGMCAQRRLKSAWASAQSDQSLHCPLEERILSYPLSTQRRLIKLSRCPGWSETSLGAHAILLILSRGGSFVFNFFLKWFGPAHVKKGTYDRPTAKALANFPIRTVSPALVLLTTTILWTRGSFLQRTTSLTFLCGCACAFELPYDKTNKMTYAPSEEFGSAWASVFAASSIDSSGPKLSSCGQRRLWSDWADAVIFWLCPEAAYL